MDINEILKIIENQKKSDSMMDMGSMYFENNKDMIAAGDFESAMKLGCFDKEFTYYGVAYLDADGQVCYRISAQSGRLYKFIEQSASEGLYPTPVIRNMNRRPAPSGHEEKIKLEVKRETGRKIREIYNQAYFHLLKVLSDITPSNGAYALLKEKQDELEGLYDATQLQLFGGLVRTAVDSKVLTQKAERELMAWLHDVEKQMEDDIVAKGQYKKVMSGFAYQNAQGNIQYFYDAKPEVTYEEKAKYDRKGVFATPVYQKEYHLREMGEFPQVRKKFIEEMKQVMADGYIDLLLQIKNLPSVIPAEKFEEYRNVVKENCTAEAYETFCSYAYRWNVKASEVCSRHPCE